MFRTFTSEQLLFIMEQEIRYIVTAVKHDLEMNIFTSTTENRRPLRRADVLTFATILSALHSLAVLLNHSILLE
jgi:hypothetical protein